MPIERRIRDRQAFGRVMEASKLSNKWFIAYSCENSQDCSRLGMVVSKKMMPKAVTRNYVKRMIREAFRQNMLAITPLDIVIRPRRPINPKDTTEGRKALEDLLLALRP